MAELTLPSKFKTLWQHCSALSNANYWVSVDGLGNAELEDDMRSAAHVVHGGMLHKFRKSGREKPHRRFVRATGGTTAPDGRRSPVVLQWDKKAAPVVRADEQVYESCFQGGPAPDAPGCFQVILDKRMVFLVADSAEEKQIWVLGAAGLPPPPQAAGRSGARPPPLPPEAYEAEPDQSAKSEVGDYNEGEGPNMDGDPNMDGYPRGNSRLTRPCSSQRACLESAPALKPSVLRTALPPPGLTEEAPRRDDSHVRDPLANWMINQAEERARVFRDLQAQVD
ncbi:hypothetical protein Ctob_000092 [Chrysochromulina tobinii]|uniref:PH domain-containing protein n=1 Tax=Chrysochromulina tobinii TaxID=1460289 RepID=A0A0M0J3M0_9EUKA|nr:hypothetical protein Ctob_000092 [Chrysochromulina tobinii]|eukprot:KOO21161.1 hypothetical protein Ctob_000092 [Chrysochromulina sp. CCMP291]